MECGAHKDEKGNESHLISFSKYTPRVDSNDDKRLFFSLSPFSTAPVVFEHGKAIVTVVGHGRRASEAEERVTTTLNDRASINYIFFVYCSH